MRIPVLVLLVLVAGCGLPRPSDGPIGPGIGLVTDPAFWGELFHCEEQAPPQEVEQCER